MEAVGCDLKYSGVALSALLLATLGTLALLLAVPLATDLRAAAMAYVFFQSARACRRLLAVRGLRLDESRAVEVLDAGGRWQPGALRDGSFVLPWLTVLRWRPAGARIDRTILLLPCMASAESLRKIRVILRFT